MRNKSVTSCLKQAGIDKTTLSLLQSQPALLERLVIEAKLLQVNQRLSILASRRQPPVQKPRKPYHGRVPVHQIPQTVIQLRQLHIHPTTAAIAEKLGTSASNLTQISGKCPEVARLVEEALHSAEPATEPA